MPKRTRATGPKLDDAGIDALLDNLESVALGGAAPAELDRDTLVQQLWSTRVRARVVIANRMTSGRSKAPGLLLELLTTTSGPQSGPLLRRIADAGNLSPQVRLEARRRAGWPQMGAAKRRREFLDSLPDPESALATFARAADIGPLTEGEILEEVLAYLAVLPPERVRAMLAALDGEPSPGAIRLLCAALHLTDALSQRRALEILTRWSPPGVEGAIGRLVRTAREPAVRAQAEAARAAVHAAPDQQPVEALPLPPVAHVWASMIDGDGGQSLMLLRGWDEQVFVWATFLVTDTWGVKDVYGMTHAPADLLETLTAEMEEQGVTVVAADLPYLRGVLARGIATNAATGQPLPPVFEVWEPWTHDAWPPPEDEPVAAVELDDAPYRNRPDLVDGSMDLINHPWFDSWSFRPEHLGPAFDSVPPPVSEQDRDAATAALYAAVLDLIREPLRSSLRAQAGLLERDGETRIRDLALAESAWLADAPTGDLPNNAFLEEMFERGLMLLTGGLPLDLIPTDALVVPPSPFD